MNEEYGLMSYSDYLKTDFWQSVRVLAGEFWSRKCALCGSGDQLDVHHRWYPDRGTELISDVILLCHECHEKFHDVIIQPGASVYHCRICGKAMQSEYLAAYEHDRISNRGEVTCEKCFCIG